MFLIPPIGFMSGGAGGGGNEPAVWNDITTLQSTELTDGGTFLYQIKEKLKSVGFTVVESYDGTNYAPGNGDIITSSTLMEQSFAWFWLRDPTSTRGWIFQHDSVVGGYGAKIKYSKTDAWAGGSFSTMPSAADQQFTLGSGSTFINQGALGEYMMGAVEGSDPYSFWFCRVTTAEAVDGGIFHLACDPFDPADVDPYIIDGQQAGSSLWSGTLGRDGWQPDGANFRSNYEVNTIDPRGVSIDGKTGAQTMFWIEDGSAGTAKGWCKRGIFHRDSITSVVLANLVSYSKDGVPFMYLKLGSWVMPWDGVRPSYPATAWGDVGGLYFTQDDLSCEVTVSSITMDGPNDWPMPKSTAQFDLLELDPPDYWALCDPTSGNIPPYIDSLSLGILTAIGSTHLMGQEVPGWNGKFVEILDADSFEGFKVDPVSVALDESFAVMYMVSLVPTSSRHFAQPLGTNSYALRYISSPVAGIDASFGSLFDSDERAVVPAASITLGIGNVNQMLWYRNKITNECGLYVDGVKVTAVSPLFNAQNRYVVMGPNSSTPPNCKFRGMGIWKDTNAERDWGPYLAKLRGL